VAALVLRGLCAREIQTALADPARGMLNSETGEPWSLRTIVYDLAALRKQWEEGATKDIKKQRARELAEMRELRRAVWMTKEHGEVRMGLALEMKLLGTEAPAKIEHMGELIAKTIVVKGPDPDPYLPPGQGKPADPSRYEDKDDVEDEN